MPHSKQIRNSKIERRFYHEIFVDTYGPEEQAMAWFYYLEEKLKFPFKARCVDARAISPLRLKDEVDVIGMAPEEECASEMFVTIQWDERGLAVPLSQLQPIPPIDPATKVAVEDWHYWVHMGYSFA